jgi:hypothetical protein
MESNVYKVAFPGPDVITVEIFFPGISTVVTPGIKVFKS